jgi:hypothetical protein
VHDTSIAGASGGWLLSSSCPCGDTRPLPESDFQKRWKVASHMGVVSCDRPPGFPFRLATLDWARKHSEIVSRTPPIGAMCATGPFPLP